jgi:hypothetical protein
VAFLRFCVSGRLPSGRGVSGGDPNDEVIIERIEKGETIGWEFDDARFL